MKDRLKSLVGLIALSVTFLLPGYALAQADSLVTGAILEAKVSVPLRASPPQKVFFFFIRKPGQEISSINPGEEVVVEQIVTLTVPLEEQLWVKVKKDSGLDGWAYFGTKESSPNFILKR